jgi:hypothetical protein
MTIVTRDTQHRSDRIGAFVDEVRRYIYNECMNNHLSVSAIDCFCHDMFVCMNRTKVDYPFLELLNMLNNDLFLKEAYLRYQTASK